MSDQITNHQGEWVRAETAQALQAQIEELTVEVEALKEQLAAKQSTGKA